MELKEKILECIGNMDTSDLIQLHNNYCDAVNGFDNYIYSMEDLDMLCDCKDAHWIACRIFYGDFNPNDDYITFNGYGNFVSLDDYNVGFHIFADDIADYVVEKEDSLYNDEIQDILDEMEVTA